MSDYTARRIDEMAIFHQGLTPSAACPDRARRSLATFWVAAPDQLV